MTLPLVLYGPKRPKQIVTVDREARLIKKIGTISEDKMKEIDRAIKTSLGL